MDRGRGPVAGALLTLPSWLPSWLTGRPAQVGWAAALAALVFVTALTPVSDGDLWWHLAAGREMIATRSFLRIDPFTLSAAGRAWPDLHWLFQLFVYGLHQLGGLVAIIVAKAALVAAGALVLLAATRKGAGETSVSWRPLLVLLLAGGLFAARHLVLARPVVFTLVFLALFLLVLEGYAAGARPRTLLWLPVLQILWVNSQGLFALGPAVIACYALGGALGGRFGAAELPARGGRTLAGALALTLLACLVTPFGLAGVALPLRLLARLAPAAGNVFSSNIAENVPPFVLERTAPGQFTHFSWALALVAASFVVGRRQLRVGRSALVLLFAGLALTANRNVLLFYWVAAPVVALNLAPSVDVWRERLRAHRLAKVPALLAVGSLLGLGALVARANAHETSIAAPAPFRVPAGGVEHLAALPAASESPGRVFAADHYGGYVTWRLYPRYKPFIDTRLVLHTGDEYTDFLGLLDHPERFDEFQRRQAFDHVLIPSAFPDRYLGLIQHLSTTPDWRLTYTDGTEVLFSRATPEDSARGIALGDFASVKAIVATLEVRLPAGAPRAAGHRHLARLLLVTGHAAQAQMVLAGLPADDPDAAALRARTHLLAGELDRAETVAQQLLGATGERPAALDLLAYIALARGDGAAALGYLRRSLAVDPFGAEATNLLGRLEAEQQRANAQRSASQ